MIEIKVTVTNADERSNAEYVRDNFEEFAYDLNGGYLTIFEGDAQAIDTPAKYENDPSILQIYNTIFGKHYFTVQKDSFGTGWTAGETLELDE